MKAAISNAVAIYQAAAPRNPLCVPPTVRASSTALVDQQAARIVELEGQLAASRAREHDLANRVQRAGGVIDVLSIELGLAQDLTPAQVVAAILGRLR